MINNLFLSNIFTSIWTSFFLKEKKTFKLKYLPGNLFYKKGCYYVNVGKNITNGMSYTIDTDQFDEINVKPFLIYDIPTFFNNEPNNSAIGIRKVKQYKGYLCDLSRYNSLEALLKNQFKSNSRYKFRRNKERLELSFDIKYKIYYGSIEKEVYDELMDSFKSLLEKRFSELKKYNDVIGVWDYYSALVYPMVLNKKALLQCIKKDEEYISISLSFVNDTILHFAVTSFNSDYKRYNLGHITITKLIEWCFDNNFTVFDFSKGENEYKLRWTDTEYIYENHILYNKKNLQSTCIANVLAQYFKLKQFLRDYKINNLIVKLKYYFNHIGLINYKSNYYDVTDLNLVNDDLLKSLDQVTELEYQKLKPIIYDRLYKYPEPEKKLSVYKKDNIFYVVGSLDNYTIEFK